MDKDTSFSTELEDRVFSSHCPFWCKQVSFTLCTILLMGYLKLLERWWWTILLKLIDCRVVQY